MIASHYRRFSSSRVVCLLANSTTADRLGAQLMSDMQSFSNEQLKFIGAGGPKMQSQGLQNPFYDTSMFSSKPFVPFRSVYLEPNNYALWWKRNPIIKRYTKPMADVMELFNKEKVSEKIMIQKPNLIITLDHDQLSWKQHQSIARSFSNISFKRPKQVHFGKFINQYHPSYSEFLDHVVYSMPIQPKNWNRFQFPSTYQGFEAFDRAYRFLLSRNGGQHLFTQDSCFMHLDHFYSETEQFIELEREKFRKKFNIPPHATVLYLAPGNELKEVQWSLPRFLDTVKLFVAQYGDSAYIEVVIPTTSDIESAVEKFVNKNEWGVKVNITRSEEDKSSAQAGSDLAICYNGEIVTECLVNQLSTIVIQNMSKIEYWYSLLWNRFINDLNILADGDLFPEIIEGQCHGPKLVEILGKWYESPPHKFWAMQHMEKNLVRLLNVKKREMGMGTHQEYYSPRVLSASKMIEFAYETEPARMAAETNEFYQALKSV